MNKSNARPVVVPPPTIEEVDESKVKKRLKLVWGILLNYLFINLFAKKKTHSTITTTIKVDNPEWIAKKYNPKTKINLKKKDN